MRKLYLKRERGPVGGASISTRAMCVRGAGRVTGAEGETVACALTQSAQSGWESVSLP
jgi:hypothetical protein